ncbi:Protein of unknown function [Sphingobium sp. AP50]|uniref:DUF3253 domain-containing protein n=1 Tax=Sphingobium sp. AP50 TaxID=1884369 RepID=UPI0008AE944E|nr:DUF3253 domain-containing protein [Sphingobium sp. AP50]SEJ97685.1 Protein of unknown function [Sphingobium sp. AP50]
MTPDISLRQMEDARTAILELINCRTETATVCPSEVARVLVKRASADTEGQTWRSIMPIVHTTIDQMVVDGLIKLSWKGKVMASRHGPYRIGRAPPKR